MATARADAPDAADVDLAWMAGMFEGEGTIAIGRSIIPSGNYGHRLLVLMTNTDAEAIEPFVALWGGRRSIVKPGGNARDAIEWRITGLAAYRFLVFMRSHFRRSRVVERAIVGMEMYEAARRGSRDGAAYAEMMSGYYWRMRELNHRGVRPFVGPGMASNAGTDPEA